MAGFDSYQFDVTRLWDASRADTEKTLGLTTTAAPSAFVAEIVQFPAPLKITAVAAASSDAAACRKHTRAELRSIAMSLRARDAARRAWIADRCGACGRCPDMVG